MAALHWGLALSTLITTAVFSVYLQNRGFWRFVPILMGALFGYLFAVGFDLVDLAPVIQAPWFQLPVFTLPDFTHPRAWEAVATIAIIAIATIPESTAHLSRLALRR